MADVRLIQGDCLDILPTLDAGSVNAVVTDSPYPCIKRDYGYWSVEEWWKLVVENVVPQVRRILKPTGSAVFILQPNSEHIGQTRGWLWEFMAYICREWNMVHDMWWWNPVSIPTALTAQGKLPRRSVKACVWCGPSRCYRDIDTVLWSEAQANKARYAQERARVGPRKYGPSGQSYDMKTMGRSAEQKGGVSPYNMLPFANSNYSTSSGAYGHGAGTPLSLASWWVNYIVPNGGMVVDPFMGGGTTGVACVQAGRDFIGIEIDEGYFHIAQQRIAKAQAEMVQLELQRDL